MSRMHHVDAEIRKFDGANMDIDLATSAGSRTSSSSVPCPKIPVLSGTGLRVATNAWRIGAPEPLRFPSLVLRAQRRRE